MEPLEINTSFSESIFEEDDLVPVRAELVRVIDESENQKELNRRSKILWCDLPDTLNSGILFSLNKDQIAVQEAIYEVYRTEESYLSRLLVLKEQFADNLKMMLNPRDWKEIFEFVQPVFESSNRFFEDLQSERRRSYSSYLPPASFCRVMRRHTDFQFDIYVRYCCNQIYQQKCLERLKATFPVFAQELKRLEETARSIDHRRTLESYLMLPVQRITILPLLIDAVTKHMLKESDDYIACLHVGNRMKQIVNLCNERAREIKRKEEMLIAGNELDFEDVPSIGLLTSNRWLVKKGQVKVLQGFKHSDSNYSSVRLRFSHKVRWLFLFSDLIIIARKRKSLTETRYKVLTYCQRNMSVIFDKSDKLNEFVPEDFDSKGFQLCLLQNHENMIEEMIFICDDRDTKLSWVEFLSSKSRLHSTYPKSYQEWDCPQMRVIIPFEPTRPDELRLDIGDLVDIREKKSDGWYYGCKCSIIKSEGWFLRTHVEKSPSVYERAKILRRNYQRARKTLLEVKTFKVDSLKRKSNFFLHK